MIETIILYAACVLMEWTPGTNNTNYEFFQSDIVTDATVENTTWVCQDDVPVDAYVDSPMWVVGLNDVSDRSVNSDTVIARWEWDFDSDGDGVVSLVDFGGFVQAFGNLAPPNNGWNFDATGDGVVGMGDFGRFVQAFGKCNDGVIQVECGDL